MKHALRKFALFSPNLTNGIMGSNFSFFFFYFLRNLQFSLKEHDEHKEKTVIESAVKFALSVENFQCSLAKKV